MDIVNNEALAAAGLWAGIHMLLLLVLALNVTRIRAKNEVSVGTGGDDVLERAIRAHGNGTEYMPAILIGLVLLALTGMGATAVHVIGALLLLARLLVSHGIQVIADGLQPTRVAGNMITWLTMLWVIGALIWGYFG